MKRSFVAMVVFAALAITAPAGAGQVSYFSGTAQYGVAHQTGYNNMVWNRVYRPAGYWFSLWYADESLAYQFDRNYSDNPFWHNQGGGYIRAVCSESDSLYQTLYNVTCQYYAS